MSKLVNKIQNYRLVPSKVHANEVFYLSQIMLFFLEKQETSGRMGFVKTRELFLFTPAKLFSTRLLLKLKKKNHSKAIKSES